MTTTQTVLQGKDTAPQGELYMSFELGDRKWQLTLSDGRRGPSRYSVDAGDTDAVADCVSKARARCGLSGDAKVHSCYEAGRDGWWLHRWLVEQGIDNIVVDSASIEVNRRARRAKTDRLDGDNALPKTIVYNLNPADNYVFASMIGNFQDGSVPGKIQFGSGWWFLDQKDGMEKQLSLELDLV